MPLPPRHIGPPQPPRAAPPPPVRGPYGVVGFPAPPIPPFQPAMNPRALHEHVGHPGRRPPPITAIHQPSIPLREAAGPITPFPVRPPTRNPAVYFSPENSNREANLTLASRVQAAANGAFPLRELETPPPLPPRTSISRLTFLREHP